MSKNTYKKSEEKQTERPIFDINNKQQSHNQEKKSHEIREHDSKEHQESI